MIPPARDRQARKRGDRGRCCHDQAGKTPHQACGCSQGRACRVDNLGQPRHAAGVWGRRIEGARHGGHGCRGPNGATQGARRPEVSRGFAGQPRTVREAERPGRLLRRRVDGHVEPGSGGGQRQSEAARVARGLAGDPRKLDRGFHVAIDLRVGRRRTQGVEGGHPLDLKTSKFRQHDRGDIGVGGRLDRPRAQGAPSAMPLEEGKALYGEFPVKPSFASWSEILSARGPPYASGYPIAGVENAVDSGRDGERPW